MLHLTSLIVPILSFKPDPYRPSLSRGPVLQTQSDHTQVLLLCCWIDELSLNELRRDGAAGAEESHSTWEATHLYPIKAEAGVKLNYDFSDLKYKRGPVVPLWSEGRLRGWIDCWSYTDTAAFASLHQRLIMWRVKLSNLLQLASKQEEMNVVSMYKNRVCFKTGSETTFFHF